MGHHHGLLADYSDLESPVHRLPTFVKFFASLAIVIATIATPLHAGAIFLANVTAVLLVAAIAGIPPFFLVRRVVTLEIFVVVAAILSLLQPGGGRVFAGVLIKSSLCLCWMTLLSNTTPFASIIELLKKLRVPSLLVTTIALMYRYLFVLRDEAMRLRRARVAILRPVAAAFDGRPCFDRFRFARTNLSPGRSGLRGDVRAGLDVSLAEPDIAAPVSQLSQSQTIAVQVRGLHFHYPTATDDSGQIHDISFSVEQGERVALIGPNGAGKSTLLLHLNGLLPDTIHGEPNVFIFGEPVTSRTLASIRRRVGFLFQDPDDQLFCPSVYDDVAFGPRQLGWPNDRVDTAVRDAMAKVRLSGSEKRSPHLLSGGEKRRACLAGLLAGGAEILVLDEPTTSLDPRSRRELISILAQLASTMIVATHDLEMVVELCPRAIVMDAGRIVADGPTRQLLNDQTLMLTHGLEVPASLR